MNALPTPDESPVSHLCHNLKLIGAHLGGAGNYEEAASVGRWRRWAYFRLSGRTIERHAVERNINRQGDRNREADFRLRLPGR
jgi:hypothetical protein